MIQQKNRYNQTFQTSQTSRTPYLPSGLYSARFDLPNESSCALSRLFSISKVDFNNRNKMINGLSPSQIQVIKKAHHTHYRKLRQIIQREHSSVSQLQPSFVEVVNNRRYYHQRWRSYKSSSKTKAQVEYQLSLYKQNETQRQRLRMIRFGRSRYHFTQNDSQPSTTKAHNFYLRKKRESAIDSENPEIAKRIINAHSSVYMSRSDAEFENSRKIVHRLEKYPIIKRLEVYSEKRMATLGIDCRSPEKSRAKNMVVRKQKSQKFDNL